MMSLYRNALGPPDNQLLSCINDAAEFVEDKLVRLDLKKLGISD